MHVGENQGLKELRCNFEGTPSKAGLTLLIPQNIQNLHTHTQNGASIDVRYIRRGRFCISLCKKYCALSHPAL